MLSAKSLLKAALQRSGYQMKKRPKAESIEAAALHLDPFYDQEFLLKKQLVTLIFDIGAHHGQTAQKYRSLFPKAQIISFEPFPDSFGKCEKLSAGLAPMQVHELAISDVPGQRTFHCTSFEPRNSLLPLDESRTDLFPPEWSKRAGEITVNVTTIDDFCGQQKIDHIDILKMDIQGGELLALQGASGLLAKGAIDLIFLEVSFTEMYEKHPLLFDIYKFVHEQGFALFDLYNIHSGKRNMAIVEGDALFIRKDLLDIPTPTPVSASSSH
jgi:FkbM family methyltransferase